ncbi:MAG TPA: hypothetical protein VFR94_18600 [Nitrososphaeraceae archaeon]|nr:hypothetical protein [Nitrososphaeraceae archaeon]
MAENPYHRKSELFQRQDSGLIGYLEEQFQYISEELTKIEYTWVLNSHKAPSETVRRDLLLRLGHILHAIEDYYFHSNFVEIYRWNRLFLTYPDRRVNNEDDCNWLLLHSLEKDGVDDETFVTWRRRLARRLRYPLFTFDIEPNIPFCYKRSRKKSEDGKEIIFTGGFAGNDMYHTIHTALVSIENHLADAQELENRFSPGTTRVQQLRQTDLVLFRVMFNKKERDMMVEDDNYEQAQIEKHRIQLIDGLYHSRINDWVVSGAITRDGAAFLQTAFDIDKTRRKWRVERFNTGGRWLFGIFSKDSPGKCK